ncbi:MAG: nucleotide exchange factor GrpE [Rhodobiaceae bacterium]|nr:MAG: nucleotide exchange factor GrpE [Rhodobiaceae bacterium]
MSDQDKPENTEPTSDASSPTASNPKDLEAQANDLLAKAAAANDDSAAETEAKDSRSEEEKIADAMAALVAENAELKDRVLRAAAEVENIRRRSEREKVDVSKYSIANFARAVLPVADSMRRAIESVPADRKDGSDDVVKSILEGVEITERALLSAFEQNGIVALNPAVGEKFDANLHEALFEVPGSGQPAGTIVQVVDIGYMIADRLLRAAKVGIAKAGDSPAAGTPPPGGSVDTTA